MDTEKPALITKQNINNFKRFADMNVSVVVCAQKINEYENKIKKINQQQHCVQITLMPTWELKSIKCIKVFILCVVLHMIFICCY